MNHTLFKPKNLEEAKEMVTGDSNGIASKIRYDVEAPAFVRKILSLMRMPGIIVDYGCGCGRLSKEILKQDPEQQIIGVEPSLEMREVAMKNVKDSNFLCLDIDEGTGHHFADVVILVFVLQHIPAVEIRETLARIYGYLKPSGLLFCCESLRRMAIRYDRKDFFDDRFLGVDLFEELARQFEVVGPVFTDKELDEMPMVRALITGEVQHQALIWKKGGQYVG